MAESKNVYCVLVVALIVVPERFTKQHLDIKEVFII